MENVAIVGILVLSIVAISYHFWMKIKLSKLNTLKLKLKRNRERLHVYKNINISRITPYLYFVIFACLCVTFIYYIFVSYKHINDREYLKSILNLIIYYWLIEYLFFERDSTYFKSIILWHSSLVFYFVKSRNLLFRIIQIKNKQMINKLIITNIEVIGIVLSELGIVLNRTSSIYSKLNIINAFIISLVLLVSLITFIGEINEQFSEDIIYLQGKNKVNVGLPINLKEERLHEFKRIKQVKRDIKQEKEDVWNYIIIIIFLKALYWYNVKVTLGNNFNKLTDNMFEWLEN